jgi:hypothetical protein
MSKRSLTFRQTDLMRAIKATVNAGIEVLRVEIDSSGKIVVVAGKAQETTETDNPWDEVRRENP